MTEQTEPQSQALKLEHFLPYKLSIVNASVSEMIAQVYLGEFSLSPQEWRVMAALGENSRMTAKEITLFSHMDKMQVSRAISRLKQANLVALQTSPDDARMTWVSLNEQGLAIYQKIVPLVLAKENDLLSVLSKDEQQLLAHFLDKMLHQSKQVKESS